MLASMPDQVPVVVSLPPAERAPGYRDSLSTRSDFQVESYGPDALAVAPREGFGAVRPYFNARRLCAAGDTITQETFAALVDDPPFPDNDTERRQRFRTEAERLGGLDAILPNQLSGIASTIMALRGDELPGYLEQQIPIIFDDLPDASLWYVTVDSVLLGRLAFLRSQLALTLTPELPFEPEEFVGLRLLSDHSFSKGIAFANAFDPILLAFTPGAFGYAFGVLPHVLILCFGDLMELRQPQPGPLHTLYEPPVLNQPELWDDEAFRDDLQPSHLEALIPWWAGRLNVLYSHAADPTRFADSVGRLDAQAQSAWLLTFERMLADAMFVAADVNGPALPRLQMAFDLLDKAAGLLGHRGGGAAEGFKRLLRRRTVMPLLERSFTGMPDDLGQRFATHAGRIFDSSYEEIRALALSHRLTAGGVRVARSDPTQLQTMSTDDYAAELVRAVRNSSHGFLEQLEGRQRLLLATHEGELPTQIADAALAAALALCADAERLVAGEWWEASPGQDNDPGAVGD